MNAQPGAVGADLAALAASADPLAAGPGGASRPWTVEGEDLRASLLVLGPGSELAAHTNREADLVVCGVSGRGTLSAAGRDHDLRPGVAVHIPKGVERSVRADPGGLAALVVHRKTAASSSWRWRPRRRRPWEDPWEEIDTGARSGRSGAGG